MRSPTVVSANVTGLIAGIGMTMMMSMIIGMSKHQPRSATASVRR
jgi:ferredoxin-NADP reductase